MTKTYLSFFKTSQQIKGKNKPAYLAKPPVLVLLPWEPNTCDGDAPAGLEKVAPEPNVAAPPKDGLLPKVVPGELGNAAGLPKPATGRIEI